MKSSVALGKLTASLLRVNPKNRFSVDVKGALLMHLQLLRSLLAFEMLLFGIGCAQGNTDKLKRSLLVASSNRGNLAWQPQ